MAHALFLLADAGLPMIALTFPLMLLLVIPVIVVEALLCKKWLELSTWEAMKSNALSNLPESWRRRNHVIASSHNEWIGVAVPQGTG
jgi:hypothetical protein